MATGIEISTTVRLSDGATRIAKASISVDAYDRVGVSVAEGGAEHTVDVQPGETDEVLFMLVEASAYSDQLTYKVNGAGSDIALDAPHILTGSGAISLLPDAPKALVFKNSGAGTVDVNILVGRTAVTV
jgi:hypothetical protein